MTGKQWKQWLTLFSWAPKSLQMVIAAMKLKTLLGRKAMTDLDSILKSRDIAFLTKVNLVKAMVFPVVMYGCESWTVKKAECQRINACELWYWKRLLRVPWTTRKSNQSILKEMNSGYPIGRTDVEAEVPVLWPSDMKSLLIEKTLMLGKIEGKRRKGQQRLRCLGSITDSLDMNLSKLWEIVDNRRAWCNAKTQNKPLLFYTSLTVTVIHH